MTPGEILVDHGAIVGENRLMLVQLAIYFGWLTVDSLVSLAFLAFALFAGLAVREHQLIDQKRRDWRRVANEP